MRNRAWESPDWTALWLPRRLGQGNWVASWHPAPCPSPCVLSLHLLFSWQLDPWRFPTYVAPRLFSFLFFNPPLLSLLHISFL